ncbi:hypothetical protein SARC_09077, partial [Sphaeroforma arctica JP610]
MPPSPHHTIKPTFLGKYLAETFAEKGYKTHLADRIPFTESTAGHIQRARAKDLMDKLGKSVTVGDTCGISKGFGDEFSTVTNINRQVSCIQFVLDQMMERPTLRLVIVSSMAMGMSVERDAASSGLIEMYSGLAFAYHEEYGIKISLVHTTAELFGAWEHPQMPVSQWTKALELQSDTLSEVTGHGLMYVGDAANAIHSCMIHSRDWDVWEVRAGAHSYTDVWETLAKYYQGNPESREKLPADLAREKRDRVKFGAVKDRERDSLGTKLHLLPHTYVTNAHSSMLSGASPP